MSHREPEEPIDARRRRLVLRMGIVAAAAYAAPVLMQLGGRANASSFSVSFSPSPRARRPAPPPPPPEIVVGSEANGDIDAIAGQGFGLIARDSLEAAGLEIARFSLPPGLGVEQARLQIAQQFPAALFDINHAYAPEEFACGEDGCMAFDAVGWSGQRQACDQGVRIGMIDTSVNLDHAALQHVDIETTSAISADRAPASAMHGTAVAILMAGRQDTRTPGLLEGARIVAMEAFHRDQAGRDQADSFDVARAMDRLLQNDIGVINLSFAGPDNAILKRVVEAALERDVILVAAAGNSGPSAEPLFPAAYDDVVAVTAVDAGNRVYRQANAGDHVDFAAPGVQLWTAASVSGGRFRSGTSYAAPFVTVALALARARWPEASSRELVERLASSAVDLGPEGRDPTYGWGLVQAEGLCVVPARTFPAGG